MSTSPLSLDQHWQAILQLLPAHHFNGQHIRFDGQPALDDSAENGSIYPLPHWGCIAVEGPEAATFLQGQLTADAANLAIGESAMAAHCDPKGRMHANFYLYRLNDQCFYLLLPLSMVGRALEALKKYAVFSKAELSNLSHSLALFAVTNQSNAASKCLSQTCESIQAHQLSVGNGRQIIIVDHGHASSFIKTINSPSLTPSPLTWQGSSAWEYQLIQQGIGFIQPATAGEIIPQMLNLDALEGISFTKGCYTGQEIIARMKYRGKVKRRCYPFSTRETITADQLISLSIGSAIFDSQGNHCGVVISSVIETTTSCRGYGLAVLKVAAIESGNDLSLTDKDIDEAVVIDLGKLPYPLDE